MWLGTFVKKQSREWPKNWYSSKTPCKRHDIYHIYITTDLISLGCLYHQSRGIFAMPWYVPQLTSKLLGIRMRGWTLSLIPMQGFFSKCWDPHRSCCRLFFSKKIPPEKKKHTHTRKIRRTFFLGIYFLGALEISMISKIPGWVSLPINDLQSTLVLAHQADCKECISCARMPFVLFFLGAAGWSPSNGGWVQGIPRKWP